MPAKRKKRRPKEVHDYDDRDTSVMIDRTKRLRFEDLGLELPKVPASQVISIRLPTALLKEIRAFASQRDVPYQALIKLFLSESLDRRKKTVA